MTFREAFLEASDRNKKVKVRKRLMKRMRDDDPEEPRNKRRWARMEKRTADRYLEDTGRTVTDFGDGTFLDWLIENLPKILELIMSLLAMFGI